MGEIKHKKTTVNGIEFHSQTEAEYYKHLRSRDDVKHIVLQPEYELLGAFKALCANCGGSGKELSKKTGNSIQCKKCSGEGSKKRRAMMYTADFEVTYKDGKKEVIDVKGKVGLDKQFPLRKKIWEWKHGQELVVVVKDKKKGWARK